MCLFQPKNVINAMFMAGIRLLIPVNRRWSQLGHMSDEFPSTAQMNPRRPQLKCWIISCNFKKKIRKIYFDRSFKLRHLNSVLANRAFWNVCDNVYFSIALRNYKGLRKAIKETYVNRSHTLQKAGLAITESILYNIIDFQNSAGR